MPGGTVGGKAFILFPTVAAVMFAVGLLAAAGPARRGLAVEPTDAPAEYGVRCAGRAIQRHS